MRLRQCGGEQIFGIELSRGRGGRGKGGWGVLGGGGGVGGARHSPFMPRRRWPGAQKIRPRLRALTGKCASEVVENTGRGQAGKVGKKNRDSPPKGLGFRAQRLACRSRGETD